ncbi:N-acetylneuraminate synthase family protein [bacterium]|nr:N-acetylneuraminate synthase family protein [bacterium]
MDIGGKINSCLIIAEIAQAHDGSIGLLHSYVDAVANTGVDIIKFQTHIAEAESSAFEPFRVDFSYEDSSRFDYWKRVSLDKSQWAELKQHSEEVGLEFMSSPFSCAAVDLLEELGVKRYKIGSGEVTNHLMLEKIANTGKNVILSSGLSDFNELDAAVAIFMKQDVELTILQCTTKYPTEADDIGLHEICELRQRYQIPVGLSDHSGKIWPSIAAAALGADVIEVHAVFDQRMFGPDSTSSLQMDELTMMTEGVRFIERAMSAAPYKKNDKDIQSLKAIFEKSLAVNVEKRKGDIIELADLEAKKPTGRGISASHFRDVVGKALKRDIKRWDFIGENDIK